MPLVIGRILNLLVVLMALNGTRAADAVKVRVLTYNIHHAEGNDNVLDIHRIAKLIKDSAADLVAVQEVDQKTTRVKGIDQAAELGRLTGLNSLFGKAMDFQGGGYGQALLSRWEINEHKVHQLPQKEGREPRILVLAKVAHPAGDLWVGTVHLDHQLEDIRLEQVRTLNSILSKITGPVIVAGDFNALPESNPIKKILEKMDDAAAAHPQPTIPAESPAKRIDYIFTSPKGKWRTLSTKVIEEKVASDHRPVFAELAKPE